MADTIDPKALVEEMVRLHPEPPGHVRDPDRPDTTDRRAVAAYIRKKLLRKHSKIDTQE